MAKLWITSALTGCFFIAFGN